MKRINFVAAMLALQSSLFIYHSIAQNVGDFRSVTSGNWSNASTWQTFNGTSWSAAITIPNSANSVWIQSATTVILTATASCNDVHLCTNSTTGTSATLMGMIALANYSLNVYGKFRCYYGTTGTIPGTASTSGFAKYPFTATSNSGKVCIAGLSRIIFNTGEWSAVVNSVSLGLFPLEINTSATISIAVNIKVTSLVVNNGATLDLLNTTVGIDNGTNGQGNVTVVVGGTLISSASGASSPIFQRTGTTYAGVFTNNGTTCFYGTLPTMAMSSVVWNGLVKYLAVSGGNFLSVIHSSPSNDYKVYHDIQLYNTTGSSISTVSSQSTVVNGTLILMGTATIIPGNSSSLVYGPNGTLNYAGSSAQVTGAEWPGVNSPVNVIINNLNGVSLSAPRSLPGSLALNNGTFHTGGMLTLLSSAVSTARISSISSTADITGNIKSQRFIPALARRYRMISPNTASFSFNDLIDNIYVTGIGGSANGFDEALPYNLPSVYTYTEDTSASGRGWKALTNISNILPSGKGALVFVRGDRTLSSPNWYTPGLYPAQNEVTIDFNGTVNKGNIAPPITFTPTGDTASDGWNLVGNPFASPIDWSNVTKSNIDGSYWILDPLTGSYVGNNSGIIASGQGFFVHANGSSPAIIFNEASKSSLTPVNFFKTGSSTLKIKMEKDSMNGDELSITFQGGGNGDYSHFEDILKMYNGVINFGSTTCNHFDVQRNVLPLLHSFTDTVHLFVYAAAGSYTLHFIGCSTINSAYSIMLADHFTNVSQNVRLDPEYHFDITSSPSSEGYHRFDLVFNNISALPISLIGFTGEENPETHKAELLWQTTSGNNESVFIIERSEQYCCGFKEIAVVRQSSEHSGLKNYSFGDADFIKIPGSVYYRLKAGSDHQSYYSDIISICHLKSSETIQILPNPSENEIRICSHQKEETNFEIEIFSTSARSVIMKKILNENQGMNISMLNKGVYIAVITNLRSGDKLIRRIVKL